MKNHYEIALGSIRCFADDVTLALEEVNFLLGLAMRDQVIDKDEKCVLADIFDRVNNDTVSEKTFSRMESVRKKHNF